MKSTGRVDMFPAWIILFNGDGFDGFLVPANLICGNFKCDWYFVNGGNGGEERSRKIMVGSGGVRRCPSKPVHHSSVS